MRATGAAFRSPATTHARISPVGTSAPATEPASKPGTSPASHAHAATEEEATDELEAHHEQKDKHDNEQ